MAWDQTHATSARSRFLAGTGVDAARVEDAGAGTGWGPVVVARASRPCVARPSWPCFVEPRGARPTPFARARCPRHGRGATRAGSLWRLPVTGGRSPASRPVARPDLRTQHRRRATIERRTSGRTTPVRHLSGAATDRFWDIRVWLRRHLFVLVASTGNSVRRFANRGLGSNRWGRTGRERAGLLRLGVVLAPPRVGAVAALDAGSRLAQGESSPPCAADLRPYGSPQSSLAGAHEAHRGGLRE